jgi:hypothetical protein
MPHEHETPTDGTASAATAPPTSSVAEPAFLARARRILGGDIRPEDYLHAPEDVREALTKELARFGDQAVSKDTRQRFLNEWVLSFHHGAQPVACQRTERGVIVIAVGTLQIKLFLESYPNLEDRPDVVITTPALWQPPTPPASQNR